MVVKFSHKRTITVLALAAGVGCAAAQDAGFSQPYAAPLYLNPAYSGVSEFSRVGGGYRYAWAQLGEPYTTYALFADHYFDDFKSGVGLCAVSDRQAGGALVQSSFGASYAYNLRLAEKTFMRFGIQAQLGVTSANASKLVFPDMVSPGGGVVSAEPYASAQRTYFDMALGGVFSHSIFFAGAALHHLTGSPDAELLGQRITTPRKLTVNAGCNIPIRLNPNAARYYREEDETLIISPNVIYWQQGMYSSYAAGAYLSVKGFSGGVFYKSEVSSAANFISFSVGYSTDLVGLMYSFDVGSISGGVRANLPNTHEVSLILKIRKTARNDYRLQWEKPYRVQNTPVV